MARELDQIATELNKLALPEDRLRYKKLFFEAHSLRNRLIFAGNSDAVTDFDQRVGKQSAPNLPSPSGIQPMLSRGGSDSQARAAAPIEQYKPKFGGFSLPGAFVEVTTVALPSPSMFEKEGGERTSMTNVFLQYAQINDDYKNLALELANRLREDGLNAIIDLYDPHPPEGWQTWMRRNLSAADFILILCSEENLDRFNKDQAPPVGRGATFEGQLIQQHLYNDGLINKRFIPVLLRPEDQRFIPEPLQSFTYYRLFDPRGYNSLYRQLTAQPDVIVPPLGALKKMPPS